MARGKLRPPQGAVADSCTDFQGLKSLATFVRPTGEDVMATVAILL